MWLPIKTILSYENKNFFYFSDNEIFELLFYFPINLEYFLKIKILERASEIDTIWKNLTFSDLVFFDKIIISINIFFIVFIEILILFIIFKIFLKVLNYFKQKNFFDLFWFINLFIVIIIFFLIFNYFIYFYI